MCDVIFISVYDNVYGVILWCDIVCDTIFDIVCDTIYDIVCDAIYDIVCDTVCGTYDIVCDAMS